MAFFNEFPHTRFYDADLGWIIQKIKKLLTEYASIEEWRADHQTEYEILAEKVDGLINNLVDVITPWDAGIEYHIFSMVEYQGQNYIAVQDVPVGIMITNTDYWQPANTVVEQINAMASVVSDLNRWRPYVTAEEYGAVGDGETDDTLAIERAIAGSIEEGKPLVMTDHVYLIGRTITIRDDNVQIYCYGEIKYTGTGYAIEFSGWYNTLHIKDLTARDGSGILVTPYDKSVYMADIKIGILTAKNYGVKFKDYVNPEDATDRFGILYDKLSIQRVRTDDEIGHCIDFESDYFIGEIDMNIELLDHGAYGLYADGSGGNGINMLRTSLFASEGAMNIFYLNNVMGSVFNGLRYDETVAYHNGQFVQMVENCFGNEFHGTTILKASAIDVSGITETEVRYNYFTMPLVNAANRIIAMSARCNGKGMKYDETYESSVVIRNTFDYYPDTFQWALPTMFVVAVANTADDYLRIHLTRQYAWDSISRITIVMNGGTYRPVLLDYAGNVIYDFRNQPATVEGNGTYELVFARTTDTTQSVQILKPANVNTISNVPV